jgi:hypothetical protein
MTTGIVFGNFSTEVLILYSVLKVDTFKGMKRFIMFLDLSQSQISHRIKAPAVDCSWGFQRRKRTDNRREKRPCPLQLPILEILARTFPRFFMLHGKIKNAFRCSIALSCDPDQIF